jgi:hypothetical protein
MSRLVIRAIAGLLLVWPPLHMVITSTQGFCPWRLGGYGMYSVPHPGRFRIVRAFVRFTGDGSGCPSMPAAGVGALPPHPVEVYLVDPSGRLARLESPSVLELDQRLLRDFPRAPLARAFGRELRRVLAECQVSAEPGIVVSVDEQRLDMKSLTLHAERHTLAAE